MQRTRNKERGIPNESHPVATNGNESHPLKRVEANEADTDTDTDTDTEYDTDTGYEYETVSDYEKEYEKDITSTKLMTSSTSENKKRHRDFEAIKITAQAIDEASDGEYPYVERLVKRYFEINEERGWIGSDGEPIVDPIRWYKQYLDAELPNGYQVKDIAISEG